jgi:hypothetical protein
MSFLLCHAAGCKTLMSAVYACICLHLFVVGVEHSDLESSTLTDMAVTHYIISALRMFNF